MEASKSKSFAKAKPRSNQNANQVLDDLLGGNSTHSERLILSGIINLLDKVNPDTEFARRFCAAVEGNMELAEEGGYNFPLKKKATAEKSVTYYDLSSGKVTKPVLKEDWATLKKYFSDRLKALPLETPDLLSENLQKLGQYLGINQTGISVLQMIRAFEDESDLRSLFSMALKDSGQVAAIMALMTDRREDVKMIADLIGPEGNLMSYGLIYRDYDEGYFPSIDGFLQEILEKPDLTEGEIVGHILGKPANTPLQIDDFSHLGEDLKFLVDFVSKAIERGDKGINILLYGPPGGGKTELAKALAQHIGLKLYAVGEDKSDNAFSSRRHSFEQDNSEEKASEQRMSELLRAQAFLKGSKDAVLLFDEIEDLLLKGTDSTKPPDTESKIAVNRLLENNDVVTIWTGNDPEKFHTAVRQRFSYSLSIGYPPTLVRERIWQRQMDMKDASLPAEDVLFLARKYDAPPRMIAKAVQAMAVSGGGRATIERFLNSDSKIVYGHREAILAEKPVPAKFDLSLVNAGDDLPSRFDNLVKKKSFALLAAETNKADAGGVLRYLAERRGMNVIEASMKDLSQPTMQQSPADRIRSVFQTAADEKAFLVIRDIEHLTPEPHNAGAGWDSDLVRAFNNESRTHKLPFAVTSEKTERLSLAFVGQFSDRLNVNALNTDQVSLAWSSYFGSEAPPAALAIKGLTQEVFADTAELLETRGGGDEKDILRALENQQALRRKVAGNMGFYRS